MSDFLHEHLAEIRKTAERLRPYIRLTPALATDVDPQLVLKPECLQVTGSFKPRGAFNAVLGILERQPGTRGVIAVSSGNHAQGVALAARTFGLTAVVVMPGDANPAKVGATKALGAEVITKGVTAENRETVVRQLAEERGLALVHPFDNWDVIHGQATAALELLADRPDVRTIVTPVGGGGLISGTALAAKGLDPSIRVVGVEPDVAADAAASLRTGSRESLPGPPPTMADGVRTLAIGERNFEVMVERHLVDDIVTVSEQELANATLAAWQRLKLAVEPTGALPFAAYLSGKLGSLTAPTALVLSGGNANRAVMADLLANAQ
ncbi:MAG: threonine/serine dehydratase [Chloroflexi bacterium]|nr:threonine/serine dehydratase [Chloroflexota bacterium]